jgi:pimeloyl-ACP methyl ester carboxylesterase
VHINSTERLLNGGWDDAESLAEACYSTMNATGELIGTAFVARDMVEIIDALGEDGLLRYWGLSYGSQLGSTFAAMFPERVDRVLLDAVVNPHDYAAGHWGDYLVDADKTLLAFLDECAKAKDRCALVQYTGLKTAVDLLEVLNAGLEPLLQNSTTGYEGWLAYSSVKQYIYSQLYWPKQWPALAETITGVLNGSLTDLAPSTQAPAPEPYNLGVDSINGIRCSDALWHASSPEEILDQVEYQATVSESFSDVGYEFTWACAAWKMEAKEQYTGNFSVKTKFPILLVNGAFDVATPLVSAFNASAGFEDSVVLTHNGYGVSLLFDFEVS